MRKAMDRSSSRSWMSGLTEFETAKENPQGSYTDEINNMPKKIRILKLK